MYLLVYNTACLAGWLVVLVQTLTHLIQHSPPGELYSDVKVILRISQTLALLEVVHAAARLVRSPVMTVAQQVASRIFVVWGILYTVPGVTEKTVSLFRVGDIDVGLNLYTLLIAWSVTEVIRYAFYACKETGAVPYFITWLRYTTFIVLYPIGVSSELAMVWLALPAIRAQKIWTHEMPNTANMAFDYYTACILIAACYAPGFPPMYMYMFRQRRKVLGAPGDAMQPDKKVQ